ncbi:hypothetical protein SLW73_04570 [Glutamicibacter protophormiae]|uniref:hypothetical protein n=1 Tax=Glutamicibacter protophormiae TaxID=37930 RepID=UPI002A7FA69F|nr:hypothetical protein [Glutamicibacter protophormiae]WPR65603.1 hypothetical protein SLW72_04570 [Glutamicibacter protophormiae]WPR69101.1 hypothetical protein SLW73_04570 [Glutamicibacter protophormiae]
MRLTADAAPAQQVRRLALGIFHFLAPVTLATLLLLWAMDAGGGIFREVLAILLGLFAVSMINLRWKVLVHLSVGTYAALQAANGMGGSMPLVLAGIAVLSWARIRSGQHTASQVCGGVLVGGAIHDAGNLLGTVLG